MVLFVGEKSSEISNKRRSLKAADSSESRGHPRGFCGAKSCWILRAGFCDACAAGGGGIFRMSKSGWGGSQVKSYISRGDMECCINRLPMLTIFEKTAR